MMTRKEAKKQFKAFRKMAHSRYDHMGTGQKVAGFAMAGVMIGLVSWLGKTMMTDVCAAPSKAEKVTAS